MPDVGFGGLGGSGFSANVLTSGPIALPTGRVMASGYNGVMLIALYAYVGGNGGTRSVTLSLAGAAVAISAVSDPHPVAERGGATNGVLVTGGSANLIVSPSGSINFERGGGGATTPGSFSGTIGGHYTYAQAPQEPTITSLTSDTAGQATLSFLGGADNGGLGVSGWVYQWSHSATFTTLLGSQETVSGGPHTLTGCTPGATVYARVAARNAVTDAAGTAGPWSTTASVLVLSGVRVGISGSWVDCSTYVGINGAWVPASVTVERAGAWTALTS